MLKNFCDSYARQVGAAIKLLEQLVDACPDPLWDDRASGPPVWQVIYHAAFYQDFYLRDSEEAFEPQPFMYVGLHDLGNPPKDPLTKDHVRGYLAFLRGYVADRLAGWNEADLAAPSPFPWLPMSRLESLLYSLRHLQHHGAELNRRLPAAGLKVIPWIGIDPLVPPVN